MADLFEVPFDGGEIYFAVRRGEGGQAYAAAEVTERAAESFEEALGLMRRIGERMAKELVSLKCQSAEANFGLTLSAKGKFVVAEASAQASLSVKLVFKGTD